MKLRLLRIFDPKDQRGRPCVVVLRRRRDTYTITLVTPTEKPVTFSSTTDYEEVLLPLRRALESRGLRLLCNRFRRNAFVSSMARQMSDGLGCYLVQPGEPVRPDTIVSSLGAAPAEDVVSEAEQEEFIRLWIESCN